MAYFFTLAAAAITLAIITRDGNPGTYVIFAGAALYGLMFVWLSSSKTWLATLGKLVVLAAGPTGAYFFLREYYFSAAAEIFLGVAREIFLPSSLALIAIVCAARIKAYFAQRKAEQPHATG
jgi:hypothetical protein